MRQIYSILLMTLLFCSVGLPAYTQEGNKQIVTEEAESKTKIRVIENRIIIENLPKDDLLEIYNIMGVKVFSRRVKAGTNEYTISLTRGYYIIKIGEITKKIAIR
ncbi:MAG: T9SS type A sorting domain-containing protein [Bacteroidales bacterium]|jgi:hypothetical protein|nr:T9SS type A sorting domain-containing protein [Bacteroidales bacterium]